MSALSTRAFDALSDDSYRFQNRANQRLNAGKSAAVAGAMAEFDKQRPRNIRSEAAGNVAQAETSFANAAKAAGVSESHLRKYLMGGVSDADMATPEMQAIVAKMDPNSPEHSPSLRYFAKSAAVDINKTGDRMAAVGKMTAPNQLGPSTVPTPPATPADPTQPIVSGPPAPGQAAPQAPAAAGAPAPQAAGDNKWETDTGPYDAAMVAEARRRMGYFKDEGTGRWFAEGYTPGKDGEQGTQQEYVATRLNVRSPEMQSMLRRLTGEKAAKAFEQSDAGKAQQQQITDSQDALDRRQGVVQYQDQKKATAQVDQDRAAAVQQRTADADFTSKMRNLTLEQQQTLLKAMPALFEQQQKTAAENQDLARRKTESEINKNNRNPLTGEIDVPSAPTAPTAAPAAAPTAPQATAPAPVQAPAAAPPAPPAPGVSAQGMPAAPAAQRSLGTKAWDAITGGYQGAAQAVMPSMPDGTVGGYAGSTAKNATLPITAPVMAPIGAIKGAMAGWQGQPAAAPAAPAPAGIPGQPQGLQAPTAGQTRVVNGITLTALSDGTWIAPNGKRYQIVNGKYQPIQN